MRYAYRFFACAQNDRGGGTNDKMRAPLNNSGWTHIMTAATFGMTTAQLKNIVIGF